MAGAKKPDGKAARTERVTFTRPAADRIAKAVRQVEAGNREGKGLVFGSRVPSGVASKLKVCKTSADWDVGTLATLEVWHDGTPPSESDSGETIADVVNKVAKVLAGTFVIIGEAENGSWYLVEICRDCESGHRAERLTEDGLEDGTGTDDLEDGDGAQVLLHHNGCLRWVNLTKVTVLTSAALIGTDLVFERDEVWVFRDANTSLPDTEIEGVECEEEPPPE